MRLQPQPSNLSLMALTIATGFVVDDDAIVVLAENIARHLEAGMKCLQAALPRVRTRSWVYGHLHGGLSLVAIFLPLCC